ncbi:hypothetical protein [Kineococcus sp. SYSU DK002]|uniref:hypothetical protein n=1 Tax=Kineococcus sp. SYSU DK002 TaxID=3383123 RepID=UPI003D7C5321
MDERLSGWEDRLRHELDASVREVRAGADLLADVREGGRRRLRRRRALVALPAAVVAVGGVVGGAVWAGGSRPPQAVVPAGTATGTSEAPGTTEAPPTAAPPAPGPVATAAPVLTMDPTAAWDAFFAAGYGYEDAVPLGEVWNVGTDEAKALGGQALTDGLTLPIPS